jgi:hypothetical protein
MKYKLKSKVNIRSGQNLFDIALQERGTIEAAFSIAKANNLSLTGDIPAGTELILDGDFDPIVYNYYNDNKIQPSTK